MTGNIPFDGDVQRQRLPASQVFRRTTPPSAAPWERQARPMPEMRSYPAPPSPDGQPPADDAVTQLIPRFRDEDYPEPPTRAAPQRVPASDVPERKPEKSLLASTGSIAVATLVSRITGFGKQIIMLALLGPAIASAFTVSTILPNMISELVLGAVLSAIVVPVLVRAEREDADGGASFVRRLFTIAVTVLGTVAIIATLCAPLLSRLMIDENAEVSNDLVTALSYLLLPALLFYGLSALLTAILNTRQNFRPGAWAPVWNNLVVLGIFSLYFVVPGEISLDPVTMSDPKLLILGLGVTAGVVTQVLTLVPALRREKISLKPLWGFDARLKSFAGMGAAIVLYVVISQAGMVVATNISSGADQAGPAIYSQAWILLQLPYGILGVTVLTAIMPRLSRNAAAGDTPSVVDDLSVATRLTLVALVPIVTFLTFAGPWVGEALYGFGKFSGDAARLGEAVSWSAFTLIPYALVLIHLRVFYAREQAWTPTWIILGITGIKIALSLLAPVVARDNEQVVLLLGVANGLGFVVGACIGGYLLHRSLGNLRMINVGKTVWMVLLASLAGGSAMLAIDRLASFDTLPSALGGVGWLLRVGISAVLMLGITFSILWFGKIPEVLAVTVAIGKVVDRIRGRSVAAPDPYRAAEPTEIIPVVSSPAAWDTASRRLPYPGPKRTTVRADARPHPDGQDLVRRGEYMREGVRVTEDDVAGGPAEARAAGTDRVSGGVDTDRRDDAPSDATSESIPTQAPAAQPKTPAAKGETSKGESTEIAAAKATSESKDADVATEATASSDTEVTPPKDASVLPGDSDAQDGDAEHTASEAPAEATPERRDATLDTGTHDAVSPQLPPVGPVGGDKPRSLRGPKLIPGASVAGGRYRLLAPHGGARGLKFWQAHDVKLDREVALTFVDADQQSTTPTNDRTEGPQAVLSRTLRLGRINSPGLARVLDVVRGSSGGIVVAEWTPGRSLREMADTVPAPTGAARAIKALAAAAEAAHRSGGALSIDHPDRVRISSSGNAVLAFPATLADADPSSDVRGLGAMLYALITARWPLSDNGGSVVPGAEPRSVGGMKAADRDDKGNPLEPNRVRPDVPFEISAVATRALEQNSGIRTAATVQHVLDQAAVVNDKTDLMPALRLGQRAPGASGHSLADPEEIAAQQKRSMRTNIALAVLGLLTVLVLAFAGKWIVEFLTGSGSDEPLTSQNFGLTTSAPVPAGEAPAPGTATAPAAVPIQGVSVFSPEGDADNSGSASNAIDNNPNTTWTTDSYFQPFPALKDGVGLLARVPADQNLTSAFVNSPSPGTTVEIRSAPSDSPSLSETTVIGEATLGQGVTNIPLTSSEPTGYVLLWIDGLSNVGGRNQSAIADFGFTS